MSRRQDDGHEAEMLDPYNDIFAPFPELAFGDDDDCSRSAASEHEHRPDRGWQRLDDVVNRLVDDLAVASGGEA